MKSVENYLDEYLKYGFVRENTPGGLRYTAPEHLGEGGFILMGDISSCYASVGDILLKKDIVTSGSINERFIEFGYFSMGNAEFYKKRDKQFPLEHGLNFIVHATPFSGYMRIKAHQRLVCNGLILREKFISSLPYDIPEDFWEASAHALNRDIIDHSQLYHICEQIKNCRLTGVNLDMYIKGKGLETLALILDYVYTHKKKPAVRLSPDDRKALKHAQEILYSNLTGPPSIIELSKRVGINQQKLMTGFKQLTGITVYGFLKKIRMEKAFRLLRDTDTPIALIAREVGYHGDGHFQKAFVSEYGVTPIKMRRQFCCEDV